jgi:hypothetical protein
MLPGTGSLIEGEKSVSIRSDRFDRLILVASSVGLGEVIGDGLHLRITDRRVVDINNFRDLALPGFSFSLTLANWTRATFFGVYPLNFLPSAHQGRKCYRALRSRCEAWFRAFRLVHRRLVARRAERLFANCQK